MIRIEIDYWNGEEDLACAPVWLLCSSRKCNVSGLAVAERDDPFMTGQRKDEIMTSQILSMESPETNQT
ncbi:hypothetical protein OUZ56_007566 [Daphnia magna]|uniref:Uncharacterized protein n=1 Tax=Daphnia magna TaxID=35525 RepID=A0ABR0AAH2_9CRUS|nr:hypothetical protein OUZ56_007566 [Daphnia magna]